MKLGLWIMIIAGLALYGWDSDEIVAGDMSKSRICSSANTLLKNNLGQKYTGLQTNCSIETSESQGLEILSEYTTPTNKNLLYTIDAQASGNTLTLKNFKVKVYGQSFDVNDQSISEISLDEEKAISQEIVNIVSKSSGYAWRHSDNYIASIKLPTSPWVLAAIFIALFYLQGKLSKNNS